MSNRLLACCEANDLLCEEQLGFRRFRSCQEQLHNLHNILLSRKSQGLPTFAAFLDMVKAYDYVWKEGFLVKLARCGVTGRMWRTLRSFHSAFRLRLHDLVAPTAARITETWTSDRGLPQGTNTSCVSFDLHINDIMVDLKGGGLGVSVSGLRVPGLMVADDIVLLAPSAAELSTSPACVGSAEFKPSISVIAACARRNAHQKHVCCCALVAVD